MDKGLTMPDSLVNEEPDIYVGELPCFLVVSEARALPSK